jgi:hypothetical protein
MSARIGLTAAALAGGVILLAGCGSMPTAGGGQSSATGGSLPLATSLARSDGASWAVVQIGGSSLQQDNFWELFVRPAGTAAWQLATPPGVADNGGLAVADTGARSLISGFRPSQKLTFSPLAASADGGANWSPGSLVSPGLANVPDALAADPAGQLLALTSAGGAELGTRLGAQWTELSTGAALARTAAGRACGLARLTAAAFTPTGVPLLAGACTIPQVAGIFAVSAGEWRAVGPELPAGPARGDVEVLGLVTAGARTTAVLTVGHGPAAGVVTSWSDDGGSHWTSSLELRTGGRQIRSASLSADGAVGLVLGGGRGDTIAGPAASWQPLPALPPGTATLAVGPAGQLDALAVAASTLSAWRLGAGSEGWNRQQQIKVAIPYGSSG